MRHGKLCAGPSRPRCITQNDDERKRKRKRRVKATARNCAEGREKKKKKREAQLQEARLQCVQASTDAALWERVGKRCAQDGGWLVSKGRSNEARGRKATSTIHPVAFRLLFEVSLSLASSAASLAATSFPSARHPFWTTVSRTKSGSQCFITRI